MKWQSCCLMHLVTAIEMNITGHFMDDDDDDNNDNVDDGGGDGGGSGDDDVKYSSPLYMTAFPYL